MFYQTTWLISTMKHYTAWACMNTCILCDTSPTIAFLNPYMHIMFVVSKLKIQFSKQTLFGHGLTYLDGCLDIQ